MSDCTQRFNETHHYRASRSSSKIIQYSDIIKSQTPSSATNTTRTFLTNQAGRLQMKIDDKRKREAFELNCNHNICGSSSRNNSNRRRRRGRHNNINSNYLLDFLLPSSRFNSKTLKMDRIEQQNFQQNNIVCLQQRLKQHRYYITNNKLAFVSAIIITLVGILLISQANVVESLNCYTCSSADNPGCDEAFTGKDNITDTDCEKQIGKPAKVCRKLVQHIEHKKVVIRSCGWIDEHDDSKPMCYKRSGTFAIMMESCVCYEDNCNHSASLVPNQSVLLLLISSFSLVLIYNYVNNLTTITKKLQ